MKKREILSALGLAVLLIVGLGFVYMVTVEEDALGVATFHHKTWIPLLVLALGAAGCLYGMDAVRALKKQNPLNLRICCGTKRRGRCAGTARPHSSARG